jgi:predicted DNA-binding protein
VIKLARDARVNILTTEEIKQKLEYLAERMGMTTSALGSYIIGNFIYQQEELYGSLLDVGRIILERSVERAKNMGTQSD